MQACATVNGSKNINAIAVVGPNKFKTLQLTIPCNTYDAYNYNKISEYKIDGKPVPFVLTKPLPPAK